MAGTFCYSFAKKKNTTVLINAIPCIGSPQDWFACINIKIILVIVNYLLHRTYVDVTGRSTSPWP